jgi:hypothetical protein
MIESPQPLTIRRSGRPGGHSQIFKIKTGGQVERQLGVMKEKASRSLPVQDSLTPMKQKWRPILGIYPHVRGCGKEMIQFMDAVGSMEPASLSGS